MRSLSKYCCQLSRQLLLLQLARFSKEWREQPPHKLTPNLTTNHKACTHRTVLPTGCHQVNLPIVSPFLYSLCCCFFHAHLQNTAGVSKVYPQGQMHPMDRWPMASLLECMMGPQTNTLQFSFQLIIAAHLQGPFFYISDYTCKVIYRMLNQSWLQTKSPL